MAFGLTTKVSTYVLVLFNSNTLPMAYERLCMGQRFCKAVASIAEFVRVKKVAN